MRHRVVHRVVGRLLLGFVLAIGCAFLAASPAFSADSSYYSTKGEFGANPPAGVEGQSINVRGTGFKPGSRVDLVYAGKPVGSTTADKDGVADGTFKIPGGMQPGPYDLVANGLDEEGAALHYKTIVSVLPSATSAAAPAAPAGATKTPDAATGSSGAAVESAATKRSTGDLPRTGAAYTIPLLALAAGSLALGTAFLVSARRRRAA